MTNRIKDHLPKENCENCGEDCHGNAVNIILHKVSEETLKMLETVPPEVALPLIVGAFAGMAKTWSVMVEIDGMNSRDDVERN
jgi:hypothetical protein